VLLACLPFVGAAQDMDSLEGVYREQYQQYTAQETMLQQQVDALASVKSQVDDLISQVSGTQTTNYAQEAERYRQLQTLLPSAIQYSTDLAARDKQLTEVRKRKAELRDTILARQSALPVWWTQ
jgi:prefoldin subunit 5